MDQYLDDLQIVEEKKPLIHADGGKRFVNYIVDVIFFYFVMIAFGVFLGIVAPDFVMGLSENAGSGIMDRVFSLLFYAVLMGVMEGSLKGKTIGKYFTKTRAVNMDGTTISWEKAFARGFSRAVPFCAFSALGTPCFPWQDRWTDTMVIDENVYTPGRKKSTSMY